MLRVPHTVQFTPVDVYRNVYDMVRSHMTRTGHACRVGDLERLAHAFHGFAVPVRRILADNPHVFVCDNDFVSINRRN